MDRIRSIFERKCGDGSDRKGWEIGQQETKSRKKKPPDVFDKGVKDSKLLKLFQKVFGHCDFLSSLDSVQ